MYKKLQNKKYYLAFHSFPKTAKKGPYNYAYLTGYRKWESPDMITSAIVIGTFRVMFGIKKPSKYCGTVTTQPDEEGCPGSDGITDYGYDGICNDH